METIQAFLASVPTGQVALGALVSWGIYALMKGLIIPRSTVDSRILDKDAEIDNLIEERNDWKKAHQDKTAEAAELLRQNGELLEGARTTKALIEALKSQMNPRKTGD